MTVDLGFRNDPAYELFFFALKPAKKPSRRSAHGFILVARQVVQKEEAPQVVAKLSFVMTDHV